MGKGERKSAASAPSGAERTNTQDERSVALAVFDLVSRTRPAFQTSVMVFLLAFGIPCIFPKGKLLTFALLIFWATKCLFFFFFSSLKECILQILPQAA